MRSDKGFSLIELLLVVALLLIIAGMAIPSLLRSKISANESSAISTLRVLHGVEMRYSADYNSYSQDLRSLGPPATAGVAPTPTAADMVDKVLAGYLSGSATQFVKAGYRFTFTTTGTYPSVRTYGVTADPLSRGSTGQRSFFMDESGLIRGNSSATATNLDLPVI